MNISTHDTILLVAGVSIFSAVQGMAIAGAVSRGLSSRAAKARHARLEAKVDLILDHLGIDKAMAPIVTPMSEVAVVSNDIRILVQRGQKIQAIKAYRDQNPGMGLKEAKDFIDSL